MRLNVRIFGEKEASARFGKAVRRVNRAVDRALRHEAEGIMRTSKHDFVPVDTGVLRSTGRVWVTGKAPLAEVVLGYGGAAKAYAVIQHENLHFHHTVGQAKYLITPVAMSVPALRRAIREEVRRALLGVGRS